jgi:predicted RNase H-like HicB family nuclease
MANKYPFNIEWSEDDQEYIATTPSFPGLSAFGETEEEALREAKTALVGFIETHKAHNIPLPEPEGRPSFSGKLQVRLEKSLHRVAAQMARTEGVSLNTYITDAVQAKVSGAQVGNRILNELRLAVASGLVFELGHVARTVKPRAAGASKSLKLPAGMVLVKRLGSAETQEINNLSLAAAQLNPKRKTTKRNGSAKPKK